MLKLLNRIDSRKSLYECGCGKRIVAFTSNVNRGHTQSCGCLRRLVTSQRTRKHGRRVNRTRGYIAWVNMKSRCTNEKTRDYANYGGRGIGYDERWNEFENFLTDMGEPGLGMSLDRVDNNGNYNKENCRWVARTIQNLNKRTNVRYELNGKSQTLAEWSRETGIGRVTMLKRIQRGVPLELALQIKGFLKMRG